jgi:hypothetical protein
MTLMRVMGEIREMKMITVHMCFENMTKYLHTAKQLTFSELLLKKMNL